MHTAIEKESENRVVYIPMHYVNIIKEARKGTNKSYKIINVKQNMILDFKSLVQKKIHLITRLKKMKIFWKIS